LKFDLTTWVLSYSDSYILMSSLIALLLSP